MAPPQIFLEIETGFNQHQNHRFANDFRPALMPGSKQNLVYGCQN
jgi:hypothetical protein